MTRRSSIVLPDQGARFRDQATLEAGDLVKFGALLHQHWPEQEERSDRISDPKIDGIYEQLDETVRWEGRSWGGWGRLPAAAMHDGRVRPVRDGCWVGLQTDGFAFDLEAPRSCSTSDRDDCS